MKDVLINLNDETGKNQYSVEFANNIRDWLDSFNTLEEAIQFIKENNYSFDYELDFRDTRRKQNENYKRK